MNTQELDNCLVDCVESRQLQDGFDAMASYTQPRTVVWWGCLCGWSIWRPTPPPDADQSLEIASRWVSSGDDELRKLAATRAASDDSGVSKWLLQAVVNSGGTITNEEPRFEKPTPDMAGRFVNGFLQNLLATRPSIERVKLAHTFVQLARQAIATPLPTARES